MTKNRDLRNRQGIIKKNRLVELSGMSYSTWIRQEKLGRCPQRIRLSPGRVGWRLEEVLDWIESRKPAEEQSCETN